MRVNIWIYSMLLEDGFGLVLDGQDCNLFYAGFQMVSVWFEDVVLNGLLYAGWIVLILM